MKVNGPEMSKLGQGRHLWQWMKHAWLNSDLLLALKGDDLSALRSQQRGPYFLRPQYPLRYISNPPRRQNS